VPTVSIERIRDWLASHRTAEDYAFSAIDIALGIGCGPAEVFVLCNSAADAGMLASVFVGTSRFFTHPLVGMEDKVGQKRMRTLLEIGRVIQVANRYEWAPPKRAEAAPA
jgi:hypothetical protein